jgi:hypothetical protein
VNRTLRSFRTAALLMLVAAPFAHPVSAAESKEDPTLSEIVNILREKGLIDDDQQAELTAKAAKEEARRSWTDRISLFGDLRGRFEAFDYQKDIYTRSVGATITDRYRARYRARLGVTADVASRAAVTLRTSTGGANPRSGNQTLGSGNDFDKDEFRLDLAYATLSPFPKGDLPGIENGYLAIDLGKVKNPFLWSALGADNLLWDPDINPEGGNLRIRGGAGPLLLFANTGVYVITENAAHKDPMVAGGQVGATLKIADPVSIGARGSLYDFFSLDDDFFVRAACDNASSKTPTCDSDPGGTGGNIINGLSRRNGSITVGETSGFLNLNFIKLLPVQFYGTYAHNFSAHPSLTSKAKSEDDAWTTGVVVGDKVSLVSIGFAYYYIEANAFPSMYLDDDVFDGFPNRKGYVVSLQRQLFENVDLGLRGFMSKRIEGGTAFVNSGPGSDRLRGQADLTFKF